MMTTSRRGSTGDRPIRVTIIYNQTVLPEGHPDYDSEWEILFTVDTVDEALSEAGYEVSRLAVGRDPGELVLGLRELQPDVIFNLFEGLGDYGDTEAHAVGLIDWLGIPYTGSNYQTLCLARNKPLTKHLLRSAGLPTADFLAVQSLPVPEFTLNWPVIVKPGAEDASVGVDQGSVVTDRQQLEDRVAHLLQTYGPPVMIEEFIRGREFNVALIEFPDLQTLPISEICFTSKDPDYWPIVTYEAKWKPESRDFKATPPRYPAEISPRLAARLSRLAREAYRLLGCRDYARVDFRVRGGKPYILEVNPNPDYSPNAGLAKGLSTAGWTYNQFTVELVQQTLARGPRILLSAL
jgi:D-alanine-D-alanine ligase